MLKDLIQPVISQEDNDALCAIPDKEEIKGAVFQLGALKEPGPDGFPAIFFQHYWKEVGVAITEMVQHFFRSSYLLKHINHSFIALLLKVNHPTRIE